MQVVLEDGERYLLRFDPGEEVMTGLQAWLKRRGITAGWWSAIGACRGLTLSFFQPADIAYHDVASEEDLEITSVLGNIALLNGHVALHAHGTFADATLRVRGGHIKRLVVSVTCEVFVQRLTGTMARVHDAATGINRLREASGSG